MSILMSIQTFDEHRESAMKCQSYEVLPRFQLEWLLMDEADLQIQVQRKRFRRKAPPPVELKVRVCLEVLINSAALTHIHTLMACVYFISNYTNVFHTAAS